MLYSWLGKKYQCHLPESEEHLLTLPLPRGGGGGREESAHPKDFSSKEKQIRNTKLCIIQL